jgi:hypothetical protein
VKEFAGKAMLNWSHRYGVAIWLFELGKAKPEHTLNHSVVD